MPDFKETLKLSDQNFPPELHERIMDKIRFIKYRNILLVFSFFSFAGLLFSTWEIIRFCVEFGTFSVLSDFIPGFELSWDFLLDLAALAKDTLPFIYLSIFAASLILAVGEISLILNRKKLILLEKLNF